MFFRARDLTQGGGRSRATNHAGNDVSVRYILFFVYLGILICITVVRLQILHL
jgi:hypothetical protein